MRTSPGYSAILLLAAAVWGFAFTAQRAGMEHVGPFTFNAVRFFIGGAVLLPLAAVLRRRSTQATSRVFPWKGALAAGTVLFLGASFQQSGIVYTTAGKAGFITGLYVVLVPLLGLFVRRVPGWKVWVGAVLAAAGLYLLGVEGAIAVNRGDLLVLVSSFFWAIHVQLIATLAKKAEPVSLAAGQFLVCSILCFTAMPLFGERPETSPLLAAGIPILYAGLLSTGVAYTLQVVAQRRVAPAPAAIILSLEAVFAALGGIVILGEGMTARGILGCALMLAAMLLAQIGGRSETEG